MRKVVLLLLLLMGCSMQVPPAMAQIQNRVAIGYAQFTVAAATALPSIPSGASEAFVVCEAQSVRWRDDGTNPTASVGVLLPVNTAFPYIGSLARIKFIETTASATCSVSYYQ
jgi:hypothetical protein